MRWTGAVDRHLLNLSMDLGGGVASDHSCPPEADHVDVTAQITGDGRGARPGAGDRVYDGYTSLPDLTCQNCPGAIIALSTYVQVSRAIHSCCVKLAKAAEDRDPVRSADEFFAHGDAAAG